MHQLIEDDEDYADELLNLNVTWNLLLPPQKNTLSMIPNDDDDTNKHTVVIGKKCNIVIVPISDQFGQSRIQFTKPGGGNHWSILLWSVMVHQQQQQHHHDDGLYTKVDVRYYHFDSCQGTNRKAAEMVAHKLHKVCYVCHRKNLIYPLLCPFHLFDILRYCMQSMMLLPMMVVVMMMSI
jgi:hypothetical protein